MDIETFIIGIFIGLVQSPKAFVFLIRNIITEMFVCIFLYPALFSLIDLGIWNEPAKKFGLFEDRHKKPTKFACVSLNLKKS